MTTDRKTKHLSSLVHDLRNSSLSFEHAQTIFI